MLGVYQSVTNKHLRKWPKMGYENYKHEVYNKLWGMNQHQRGHHNESIISTLNLVLNVIFGNIWFKPS